MCVNHSSGTTLASVMQRHDAIRLARSSVQRQAVSDIIRCRTAAMGGVLFKCNVCGKIKHMYKSCRNRHCPACQQTKQLVWADKLLADLLPVKHFQVVFTLPRELHLLFYLNQKITYELFFRCAANALQNLISHDYSATAGALAILHTWGQTLNYHPHLHFVVTSGGTDTDHMQWVHSHPRFLVDVKQLSARFRSLMISKLKSLWNNGDLKIPANTPADFDLFCVPLRKKSWNVFCEKPLKGPRQVINYLARYVNRVAISNARIRSHDNQQVVIRYNNYRHKMQGCLLKLPARNFIERFLLHILPKGFYRIRYYGLYAQSAAERRAQAFAFFFHPVFFPKLQGLPLAEVAAINTRSPFWKCKACPAGMQGTLVPYRFLFPLKE